jgi:hypothetical protein
MRLSCRKNILILLLAYAYNNLWQGPRNSDVLNVVLIPIILNQGASCKSLQKGPSVILSLSKNYGKSNS